MADKQLTIVEDEDESISLTVAPSAKDKGSDDTNPIDALTGEPMFDDIDPRFGLVEPAEIRKKKDIEVGDEPEDDDLDTSDVQEDEDGEFVEKDEEEEEAEPEDRGSKSMRKRLARERRLREESDANYKDLKDTVNELRDQLNQRANTEAFEATRSKLEGTVKEIRAKLATAIEGGQSEEQADLIEQLADAKAELKKEAALHDGAKKAAEKNTTTASPIVKRKLDQWFRKHPRFNRDPEFADIVRVIDKAVARDHFDPETDEYYREVDKRLRKHYPEEYKNVKADEGDEPQRRNKPPSQGFRREAPAQRKRTVGGFEVQGKSIKLSPRQVENMKVFGMDPQNPADVREYVGNNIKRAR